MSLANASFGSQRVRKAFEQVYDEIRQAIVAGRLAGGERLPTEAELAEQFGVGRPTVREALRLLGADGLIRSTKGTGGGSYVTLPSVEHVSQSFERHFELLSVSKTITAGQFLDVFRLIEVFAAQQAALHRCEDDLAALRATLSPPAGIETAAQHRHRNRQFHIILLRASGNALLQIAAQSIWSVLDSHLADQKPEISPQASSDHAAIIDAVEKGDEELTKTLMRSHLDWLGDQFSQIWDIQGNAS